MNIEEEEKEKKVNTKNKKQEFKKTNLENNVLFLLPVEYIFRYAIRMVRVK